MAVSPKRKAARRPAPRTIPIVLGDEYEGWEATARADFPARLLYDLGSGDEQRVFAALNAIVIDHNFPNDDGEIAESLEDVDYHAVTEVTKAIGEGLNKLPNQ